MSMIRLLIVDDHQLMREGLVRLLGLEKDIEIVGTASDGTEAVEKVGELQPSLVLMDVRMPRMSGIAATREIKARHPETEVVLLTMHEEDEYVFEGLSAGASGYLLKDASHDELMSTLRQVEAGQAQIAPSVTRKLVREFASMRQSKPEPSASPPRSPRPSFWDSGASDSSPPSPGWAVPSPGGPPAAGAAPSGRRPLPGGGGGGLTAASGGPLRASWRSREFPSA